MTTAMASTPVRPQLPEEEAPPVYTPREAVSITPPLLVPSNKTVIEGETSAELTSHQVMPERTLRRSAQEEVPSADQVADANGCGSVSLNTQKNDGMLVLFFFWLPILLISLLWALHSATRLALNALKTTLSVKFGVRA